MKKDYPYLRDSKFLLDFAKEKNKEQRVKITILDFHNEKPIKEIQGRVISGNINIDGKSSIRRTANLTAFIEERDASYMEIGGIFSLNKKIKIEMGITNNTTSYKNFPIIWFPLGIYVIMNLSSSHSTSGTTVTLQLKDKMVFLNGECGGTISAAVDFHEYEVLDSATGDYIIFLDSDDYFTDNTVLERLNNLITDEDIIFLNYTRDKYGEIITVKEENGGLTATIEPTIKDSGDRTQFETGAVRDMREGKGRCDLMPLEVVGDIFGHLPSILYVFENIAHFQKEQDTAYLNLAICRFAEQAYSESSEPLAHMFLEVAKHFEDGAKKYGENNWQKGIPVHCYIDSAVRHYLKWLRGDKDEPHDRAFVWNLMCCIWEVDYHEKEEK